MPQYEQHTQHNFSSYPRTHSELSEALSFQRENAENWFGKDSPDVETYQNLLDFNYLLPAIRNFDVSSMYISAIYNVRYLVSNIFEINRLRSLIENPEPLINMLRNDAFRYILNINSDNIFELLKTNNLFLFMNSSDRSGETNKKYAFIFYKLTSFLKEFSQRIPFDILTHEDEILANIEVLVQKINEHNELKEFIASKIGNYTTDININTAKSQLQTLMNDTDFKENLKGLLSSEYFINMLQKFSKNINWDEMSDFVPPSSSEHESGVIEQNENIKTFSKEFLPRAFSLFTTPELTPYEKSQIAPFDSTKTALRFMYSSYMIIDVVENKIKALNSHLIDKSRQKVFTSIEELYKEIERNFNSQSSEDLKSFHDQIINYISEKQHEDDQDFSIIRGIVNSNHYKQRNSLLSIFGLASSNVSDSRLSTEINKLLSAIDEHNSHEDVTLENLQDALEGNDNSTPEIESLKQTISIYRSAKKDVERIISDDVDSDDELEPDYDDEDSISSLEYENKPKAILSILRNLRPFIESAHEDPNNLAVDSLANILTSELFSKDTGKVPPPEEVEGENKIIFALKEIDVKNKNQKKALDAIADAKDAFTDITKEALLSSSNPDYRDGMAQVLLNLIPALLEKNMAVVVEEAINAIALNEELRIKLMNDENTIRPNLIEVLMAEIKDKSNHGAPEYFLEHLKQIGDIKPAAYMDIKKFLQEDNVVRKFRKEELAQTLYSILLIHSPTENINITETNIYDTLTLAGITCQDEMQQYAFGLKLEDLEALFDIIIKGFVDKIRNNDRDTKTKTTRLILWFTGDRQNPNDLFYRLFDLIKCNDDLKETLNTPEAREKIISVLKGLLTLGGENAVIKNTAIKWNDLKDLINLLLEHLPRNLNIAVNNDNDITSAGQELGSYLNIDEIVEDPTIMSSGLSILHYLTKEKEEADHVSFFHNVFEIITKIPEIKDELANDGLKQKLVSIVIGAIKGSLEESNLGDDISIGHLNKIIKSCLHHVPPYATSSDDAVSTATKRILNFFVKEKEPVDTHNFYADILTIARECKNGSDNSGFAADIAANKDGLTDSITEVAISVIRNSMDRKDKNSICNHLKPVIHACLINAITREDQYDNIQVILDFFAGYNNVSASLWLENVIKVIKNTDLNNDVNQANSQLVAQVKTIVDDFTPAKWLIKTLILDLDEERLKLLLNDSKYNRAIVNLLETINSDSWLKIFTVPAKTIGLLAMLFWQRKTNRVVVANIVSIICIVAAFIVIPNIALLSTYTVPITYLLGSALAMWNYRVGMVDYINVHKTGFAILFGVVSVLTLGSSLFLVGTALSSYVLPLYITALLSGFMCVSTSKSIRDDISNTQESRIGTPNRLGGDMPQSSDNIPQTRINRRNDSTPGRYTRDESTPSSGH
jgi:hypothetical protein